MSRTASTQYCWPPKAEGEVNIFDLGTDEYCAVDDSIQWISASLNVNPERIYSGGERGSIGDKSIHIPRLQPDPQFGLPAPFLDSGSRGKNS